ncbi:MAG: glutamate formiminotransferase [Actinobacteria bacterium]|nr:glutamate formiminotransferase [Actinomycetota bacterium]
MPNVSEGVDVALIEEVAAAFAPAILLDVHRDADHGRTVLTLVSEQGELAGAIARGAAAAVKRIDLSAHSGVHPRVGALDVAPVVYLSPDRRGAACAEALLAGHLIGDELGVPVFLYGDLAAGRERAELRAGGLEGLTGRLAANALKPDFGPSAPHPSAGVALVAARPPMVAFNVELAPGEPLERAREIAAELRESGGGLPGVRAIGFWLDAKSRAQVSCNVHDPFTVPLARIVDFVRERAAVACAELVGLAPRAAFDGFPDEIELPGFDPQRHLLEIALRRAGLAIS